MGRILSPSLSPFPDAFARADERATALVPAPHRVLDDTAASSSLGRLAGAPSSLQSRAVLLFATMIDADSASGDRKSTGLNSSHSQISYAVFCLKKKNKQQI